MLDGFARPKDLAARAAELQQPALALTEHRSLSSAIQHYQACTDAGIVPILGIEQDETEDRTIHSRKQREELGHKNYHLVLLAKNMTGWRNLLKIASDAATTGLFDSKERTDLSFIREHGYGEGIICLTACIGGRFAKLLLDNKKDEALQWFSTLQNTFEHAYMELQAHTMPEQLHVNYAIAQLHEQYQLPVVITQDFHYVFKEQGAFHDLWVTLRPGMTPYGSHAFYLASGEEMETFCRTHHLPEQAIDSTLEIYELLEPVNPLSPTRFPQFFPNNDQSENVFLEELVFQELEERLPFLSQPPQQYFDRLEKELWIINRKGYAGYFLILWDLVKYAKEQAIPIGPGRGSAAGSLIAYLLGITGLDPLEHDLLFERFLNVEREALPDIDMDVDKDRRADLIQYLMDRYGHDRVAQVSNINTLKVKGAIKDVMRGLGYTPAEAQTISNMVPDKFPDQTDVTLDTFLGLTDPTREEEFTLRFGKPVYERLREESLRFQDVLQADYKNDLEGYLRAVEGMVRAYGVHGGGVIIAPIPITDFAPVRYSSSAVAPVSQWDLKDAEAAGGLKMDLLGLRTLSIIRKALELAHLPMETLDQVSTEDTALFEPLQQGSTHGLFQAEGGAVRQIGSRLRPETFPEVIDLLSLARPGPMDAKMEDGRTMVDSYIDSKRSDSFHVSHPDLEPILAPTKGTILYQEQIMAITQAITRCTLAEADSWRRAVGKKDHELIAKLRGEFIEQGLANGYDQEFLTVLVDGMVKFAGYSFNKSHSAAYSKVLLWTSYLKTYHPVEFMAALMTMDASDTEKLKLHLSECQRLQIKLLRPDINESQEGFTVSVLDHGQKAIRFGLEGIKGLGVKALSAILQHQPYESLDHFVETVNGTTVNRAIVVSLILAGAFDSFEENRFAAVNDYHFRIRGFKEVETRDKGNTAERFKESRWSDEALMKLEREYIGVYITKHPADKIPQDDFHAIPGDRLVQTAGLIESVRTIRDRNDKSMAFVSLDSPHGLLDVVIFAKQYRRLPQSALRKGRLVAVKGRKDKERGSVLLDELIYGKDLDDLRPPAVSVKRSGPQRPTIDFAEGVF